MPRSSDVGRPAELRGKNLARFFVRSPVGSAANINLRAVPGLTAEQVRIAGPGARESTRGRGEPPATAVRSAIGATQRKLHPGPALRHRHRPAGLPAVFFPPDIRSF